ncbi:hypothetical protein VTK73DRAFT_7322 [Phialemonium thermophilum]|uniref:tRNA(Ile)-lysidine synthetase n=1 Tax=Phialemonium thermophilum TaxID=223376 RepID=A0ABR3XSY0_9PEZI
MNKLSPILLPTARAISGREFLDAVQATCPPRFPYARGSLHRHVGLAVSGGVDSMALAYLCSQIRRWDPWVKISDNPVSKFMAFVIDHKLREGSSAEARAVKKVLTEKMGLKADILPLHWEAELGQAVQPDKLPNVESLARRLRYRRLGAVCRFTNIVSLFLAHHEDDQYETVLMRLISGHGMRGLRGMRRAGDIPECHDMFRVYQSGFIDDQMHTNPWYNTRPSRAQKRAIRRMMREELDTVVVEKELREGLDPQPGLDYLDELLTDPNKSARWAPPLAPLDIEDGGVSIYRPLLEFSKDRLIATCLENGIPWFEDHTNLDPTLTLRNAIRHLYRHHELPKALQKPAVLRLAERCNARAELEDAEANRLLTRVILHNFEPNTGTAIVQFPEIQLPRVPRLASNSSHHRRPRLHHYRLVAAIVVRKILSLVTPEQQVTPVSGLQGAVSRLFPSLVDDSEEHAHLAAGSEPKAFVICGVHFVPLIGEHPVRWHLSRAPYTSLAPRPSVTFPNICFRRRYRWNPDKWKFTPWLSWHLFDGRFWVRIRHRLPFYVAIRPFEAEFSKPFRERLSDDRARSNLAAMLRKYTPGKVRYTLPAIYSEGNVDALLKGDKYWIDASDDGGAASLTQAESKIPSKYKDLLKPTEKGHNSDDDTQPLLWARWNMESKRKRQLQLLALPTVGMYIAGIEDWIQWEVRYRKVDGNVLSQCATADAPERRKRGAVRQGVARRLLATEPRSRRPRTPRAAPICCRELNRNRRSPTGR